MKLSNQKNYVRISSLLSFILGIVLLAFGVMLAVKANFGITVSTSLPYVFSLRFEHMTLGTFNYIIQGIVFIIMVLMMRSLQWQHVLCFVTNIIFGYTIDFIGFIMRSLVFETLVSRAIGFGLSIIVIGFALAFFIRSGMPMLPFDMFVRELAKRINKRIGLVKTFFDLTLATMSLTMSLIFFGALRGIHIGTLVSALTIGTAIDMALMFLDKYVNIDTTQVDKLKPALHRDIFNFNKQDIEN